MSSDSLQLIKKSLYLWSTKEIMSNKKPCSIFTVSIHGDCQTCGCNFEDHLTPIDKSNSEGVLKENVATNEDFNKMLSDGTLQPIKEVEK